ncbi:MAG: TonB-dependent receptor [Betaproteobacteria bacterium]|nr:TonB-dependent receptor [Betaproteobacteria bacterium]
MLGTENTVGVEAELAYQSSRLRAGLSHGYTTLLSLQNPSAGQTLSAEPFGYGSAINHWSEHITKLQLTYMPVPPLHLHASARVLWNFAGSSDFLQFANTGAPGFEGFRTDPTGYDPYKQILVRLNLGASYDFGKHITLAAHGYNLLGLVNGTLNNRGFVYGAFQRQEAVAAALTLTAKF